MMADSWVRIPIALANSPKLAAPAMPAMATPHYKSIGKRAFA